MSASKKLNFNDEDECQGKLILRVPRQFVPGPFVPNSFFILRAIS